jgi:integrase
MAPKNTGKKVRGVTFRRGSWWARWFENGRERVEKCDTKSQAILRHAQHRSDIREGIFFPRKLAAKSDITLRAWLARVVEGSTNVGVGNERRYARRWSLYLGGRLLADLTVEDLRRIQARMRTKMKVHTKKTQPQRQWSDATVNRHFAFLRRAFSLAVTDKKLVSNPLSRFPFFAEEHRVRFLNDEELRRLRGVMSPDGWALVQFSVETGLRQSEQFGLRWDCVDLESGILTLPMPKQGKTHKVPLTDAAKHILRSLGSFLSSPFVFPSVKDAYKPLCPDSFLRNQFRPALRRAGIIGMTWHGLRHTAASRRVAAGVDLYAVKEFLGHADYETTLKYAHLAPDYLKTVVRNGSLGIEMLAPSHTVARTVAREEGSAAGSVQPVDFVVRPEGLEPPTPRSVVWCSIH